MSADEDIRKFFDHIKHLIGDDMADFKEDENIDEFIEGEDIDDEEPLFDIPHDHKPFTKAYSVSYKFGKGMDKPEIKVNGNIDPEKIKEIMARMQQQGGFPFPMGRPQGVNDVDEFIPEHTEDEFTPLIDIFEQEDMVHVIMEMPGVKKEEIELLASEDEIEVNDRIIKLPCKINEEGATSRLRNGILEIKLFKREEQKSKKKRLTIQ